MTLKQSRQLSIGIHMVLLNLVIIEWILFWDDLDAISRIGFAVVSLAIALSLTNKIGYLFNGGSPEQRLSLTLLFYTLWSLDWYLFEPKAAGILTEFSIVVFVIELLLYGVYHKFTMNHVVILLINFLLITFLRIYPNLAASYVTVSDKITVFFQAEAILCWVVCLSVAVYILLNKETISVNHKADKEAEWYGNLFSLISHNIRTPLATIMQTVDIIKLRSKNDELYFNEQLLERINQSSHRATKLCNELLNKSTLIKLQAGEQTNIELFMNNWTKENNNSIFTPASWMRETNLTRHEQLSFYIALDALLNNSLQAESDNIHICSFQEGHLSFIDNGRGMSDEVIANYGKPVAGSKNGAGLGVFFSKEILANSGWVIEAQRVEQGARVDFYRAEEMVGQTVLKSL